MIGIGKIFNLFFKGVLDADDEVAVTFTGYSEYKSDALIDIRYNLFFTLKSKIIDEKTKKNILQISKKTYSPYRTYKDIIDKSKMMFPDQKKQIEDFEEYLIKYKKSLKEEDAIKLLMNIKGLNNDSNTIKKS